MNPLDIILAVIVVFLLVRGIFRGLIKELSSIVGVIGGFYAAYNYYPLLAKYLAHWLDNQAYQNIISFMVIFGVVLLAVGFTGVVIKYLMDIASLGSTDHIGGGIFGLAKGVLISMVIISSLTTFLPKNASIIKGSRVAPHLMDYNEVLIKITPKEMRQMFDSKVKELRKSWKIPI